MSRPVKPAGGSRSDEDVLERFETAWEQGTLPRIEDFLPPVLAGSTTTSSDRRRLLEELIMVDLQRRWQCAAHGKPVGDTLGNRPLLEAYVVHWRELGGLSGCSTELVAEEYRVRCRWAQRPKRSDYAQRFPRQWPELQESLQAIDAELAEEAALKGPRPSLPARSDAPVDDMDRPAPVVVSAAALSELLRQYHLLAPGQLEECVRLDLAGLQDSRPLARELVRRGWLSPYQINQLLLGRARYLVIGGYLVLERLGEGGTGQVFKARHLRMGRLAALKLIRTELVRDADVVGRFCREIKIISKLSHPNVVHAYDAGPYAGTYFLAMEYIPGMSLDRFVKQSGPLPLVQACDFFVQAVEALRYIHDQGLVHRDIKPSNLLITEARRAQSSTIKLVDLGLARLLRPSSSGRASSVYTPLDCVMIGTPNYLAPEQAGDFHAADVRADIYSLGCTFYFLLTGQPPFPGGSLMEKMAKHLYLEAPAVDILRADLPPGLVRVLRQMMAKQPKNRFQTSGELATALAAEIASATNLNSLVRAPGSIGNAHSMALATPVDRPFPISAGNSQPLASELLAHTGANGTFEANGCVREVPADTIACRRSVIPTAGRSLRWPTLTRRMVLFAMGGFLIGLLALILRLAWPSTVSLPDTGKVVSPRPLVAGTRFTNSIGMELAYIPAGDFIMGSSTDDFARLIKDPEALMLVSASGSPRAKLDELEGPRHKVALTKAFHIGAFEVTQGQYQKVMNENPSPKGGSPNHPVEQVPWDKAMAFCTRLSELPEERQAGRTYRLPTEAEWEYACRAGTTTLFHQGNSLSLEQANAGSAYPGDRIQRAPGEGKTHPVGTYPPNAWGLHDMHGNVWEWCLDGPRPYHARAEVDPRGPQVDPKGPKARYLCVLRGGSWAENAWFARSAVRKIRTGDAFMRNGLRVVCEQR